MSTRNQSPSRKESKVERAKRASRQLRGTLSEVLASEAPSFEHDDVQALKFHGIYQQDDRDARRVRKHTGGGKDHMFMVRAKLPGGGLAPGQYLALDALADRVSWDRSLRVTTRQGIQYHGIGKGDLKGTLAEMNRALVSTLAACGDVERNVMASPLPLAGPGPRAARALADELAAALCPKTRAYHEIWLDGEKLPPEALADGEPGAAAGTPAEEPFYGETYLPRKFKTAIALPEDNSVEVHSQDLAFVALVDPLIDPAAEGDGGGLAGANVLVGGGFGMTHRKPDTYARLATPLGFVPAERIVETARAVVAVFRDHGERADRRHARLKYLLEEWGLERFRAAVEAEAGFALGPWREMPPLAVYDVLGAHEQGDGRVFYGVWVENGRVVDRPDRRTKTALARIVETFSPRVVLTPRQDVVLADLDPDDVPKIEEILAAFGVPLPSDLAGPRRHALACPALPTCGLALADAERLFPEVVAELGELMEALGVGEEPVSMRMTGCPNGCARPYNADLGFVGRAPGRYDLFVGGRLAGDRLADLWEENVPREGIVASLSPLLEIWSRERRPDEGLGDFYQRLFGTSEPRGILTGSKDDPVREAVLERLAAVA